MLDESSLDEAERWVDGWQAKIEARAAKVRELSERLAGLEATARSEDGLVQVTVGSSGVMTDLRLDDGVRRHSGQWIADQILAVSKAARRELASTVEAATNEAMGAESPDGRAILAAYADRGK